ncbi:hypothetical protein P691DRAFT_777823 [Macrolepiota fuliginosa MF-IS2]|uniref:DUF6534 domain-containing protein n=1 Tax=Macrolepiota fuliginosa MF-IS2 TaxID=1400762 RepID=A0A9P5X7G5_9AGAR|nr:hypothetical protein P691DRAFT_777823 [Macrolepiota fuliginosa MF-IS2]
MNPESDGNTLAAPFVGFVVGTALVGVTLLQSYQYFMRYPNDTMFYKAKIAALSLLDLLHFVFSADIMYTFLISNFGVMEVPTKNTWSIKALGTTQVTVVVLVQLIYLGRIYALSRNPLLNGKLFSRLMTVIIYIIGSCAIGVGIVFCYELQRIKFILSLDTGLKWVIYFGFGTAAIIDTIIAAMMCFVLYKNKLDIGIDIRPRINMVLSNLIMSALATGLLTSFVSVLYIILFFVRPDTLLYIAVTFSVTRLYTNSALAMVNARRQLNADLTETEDLKSQSTIVFPRLTSTPSIRSRSRRNNSHIGTSIRPDAQNSRSTVAGSDSGSDYDVEAQAHNTTHADPHSPYYSPLEARKQLEPLLQVQEPLKMGGRSWMASWKAQRQIWFGFPIDRRSTL